MRTQTELAIRNLELAGLFDKDSDYGGMVGEAVKKLLLLHQQEGHSGASHNLTVNLFKKVALGEVLTLAFWQELFTEHNELCKMHGVPEFTEESFEKIISRKPK